jgi:hypothetical protein
VITTGTPPVNLRLEGKMAATLLPPRSILSGRIEVYPGV